MRTPIFSCFGFALMASAAIAANQAPLTGDEIRALIGKRLTVNLRGAGAAGEVPGLMGTLTILPDGSERGRIAAQGSDPFAVSGAWKIKDGRFCDLLRPVSAFEVCQTWVRTGNKEITAIDRGKPFLVYELP